MIIAFGPTETPQSYVSSLGYSSLTVYRYKENYVWSENVERSIFVFAYKDVGVLLICYTALFQIT
jgi:hypothetical protein